MTRFTLFSSQLLPCCPPCGTVAIKTTALRSGGSAARHTGPMAAAPSFTSLEEAHPEAHDDDDDHEDDEDSEGENAQDHVTAESFKCDLHIFSSDIWSFRMIFPHGHLGAFFTLYVVIHVFSLVFYEVSLKIYEKFKTMNFHFPKSF